MRLLPWLAKIGFAAFVAALLVAIVAGFGSRLGFWNVYFGLFAIYPWSVGLALIGFVLGLAWGVSAVIANRAASARFGAVGLLGSIALLASPVHDVYGAITSPRIHDISTATDHPPEFVALKSDRAGALTPPDYDGPKPATGPNGKRSTTAQLQKKYYPNIFSHADLTPPDTLFARALKTAYAMGWNVVDANAKEGRIEATDTSLLFGLTDDIVIRVKAAGMGARLDIRSKSRVPIWKDSDLGRNAAGIRSYLKTLSKTY
jgi:hypothetical protein